MNHAITISVAQFHFYGISVYRIVLLLLWLLRLSIYLSLCAIMNETIKIDLPHSN